MPRKRSGDPMTAQGGANPPRQRQRKKKEPVNTDYMKQEANMGYDMQGMPNGMPMMQDDGSQYNHGVPPEFYYQQSGPTSTASGSMNNSYGPSSLSHGPPTNAQPMPYQDMDPSQQPPQSQQMPPPPYMHPGMVPSQSQPPPPPPQMMQQPGPPPGVTPMPNGAGNNVNPQQNAAVQSQMMLRPPPPPMMQHFPQPPLLEYRIAEMNKRMYSFNHQQVTPESQTQWWEAFTHEFFDDDSRINLILYEMPDQPKRYCFGRRFIPKFFRNVYENGVWEWQLIPRSPSGEQMSQWGGCTLECENVVTFTRLTKPVNAHVITDARMFIEFSPFDDAYGYRIKQFTLELKNTQEFIARQQFGEIEAQDKSKYSITICGLPHATISFLKICVIMEPMQQIMSYCKQNPNTLPKDALKHILFQHHQHYANRKLVNPPPPQMPSNVPQMQAVPQQNIMPQQPPMEEAAKKTRKRTRKTNNTAAAAGGGPNTATTPAKQRKGNSRASPSQSANNFPINQNYNHPQYQEVLVVGEPSLMGGDFGEEDERSISRIENTQYDGALMNHGPGSGMPQSAMNTPMSAMPTNGSTPNYSRQNSFNRSIEVQKMPPPQAAPLAHSSSSSQLTMLPPPYDMSLNMNNGWKTIPNSNNMNPSMMAQTICDQ